MSAAKMHPSTLQFANRRSSVNRINLLAALALSALAACSGGSSPATFTGAPPRELALKFDAQPASGLAGEAMSVKVSIHEQNGQLATGGGNVTIALGTNTSGGALAGTITRAAVNGVATFDDLVIVKAGQGYTLTAASPGMATATTNAFALVYSMDENETVSASNDSPETAMAITPNVPMFGSLTSPEDADYYKFHATAGQIVSVSSYATRFDLGHFDIQGIYHGWDTSLRLRLLGPDKTEMQRMSGADWTRFDIDNEIAAVRIPADGDYYLACDVDSDGSATGNYALLLRLSGAPAGTQVESEPVGQAGLNDTRASAQLLSPGLVSGQYQTPGTGTSDSDFYKIVISEPTHIHLELLASRNGVAGGADAVGWDPVLELQDGSGDLGNPGTALWINDDTLFNDPAIDYVITVPGTFFVRVGRFASDDTGSAPYLLSYQASTVAPEQVASTDLLAPTPLVYGQSFRDAIDAGGVQYFSFTGSAGDMVRLWLEDQSSLQGSQLVMGPSRSADAVILDSEKLTEIPGGASAFVGSPTPGDNELNARQVILQKTGTQLVRVNSPQAGKFGIRLELVGSGIAGTLQSAAKNHHSVHAEEGQLVTISLFANAASEVCGSGNKASIFGNWGSVLCPTIQVFDGAGKLVASTSADRPGQSNFAESMLRAEAMLETSFRAPAAGDYDVVVADSAANAQGGAGFFYALQVWKNQ